MARILLAGLMAVGLSFPAMAAETVWQIDPAHSSFQFKIRHLTVSNVKGDFGKAAGKVTMDGKDPATIKVDLTIEASSIDTGHAKRDEHLRSADFFDAVKYPTITFVSKTAVSSGPNRVKVIGDLTIKGVTKEVTVDVDGPTAAIKDPGGSERRGASGTTKINRRDFGITWNRVLDTGGLVVGDEVDIAIDVEIVRK
jgi:polyisoprenoid-binding protein YceI